MQVSSSSSTATATITSSSPELVVGQRLELQAAKAIAAGESISVNIAGNSVAFRSPVALQAGQTVPVELVIDEGKLSLKLLPPPTPSQLTSAVTPTNQPSVLNDFSINDLKPGLQVNVEVVKLLADKRLLVEAIFKGINTDSANIKQLFDVDIAKLLQTPKVGEHLDMKVVSTQPLNIQFMPATGVSREQKILDNIRQLLPQQPANPQLKMISNLVQQQLLPDNVRGAIDQLILHTIDKLNLTDSGQFKKAVLSSGVFMENTLLKQAPNQVAPQDFKANLGKLMVAVEASLAELKNGPTVNPELNKLPAQVQSALTATGKTPEQLLNILFNNYKAPMLNALPNNLLSKIVSSSEALSLAQVLTKPMTLMPQTVISPQNAMVLNRELLQLFKDVEGVHNRVQLNQLVSLKDPDANNTVASWLVDVPIKDKQNLDLIQMQIDQNKHENSEENDIWNVKLRLDTQNLGPVQAMVTFHKSDVKIEIKAERSDSAELLKHHLPELEEAINKLELTTSQLSCRCGEVEQATISDNLIKQKPTGLVDLSV